jgi:hypothetical protein
VRLTDALRAEPLVKYSRKDWRGTKAILEFNLPEEESDLRQAQNAARVYSVLAALSNYLRGELKYKDPLQGP